MLKLILVTGGAGYIGSHTNKALHNAGYDTVVLDNLSKGYENFVKWGNLENYDIGSGDIREVFEKYDIDGVIHFAGFISVTESVEMPQKYLKNNYKNTLNLLKVMREYDVDKFIFSSTAAVYGNPEVIPITEDSKLKPINPYGHSKWLVEKALEREAAKGDFNYNYVALRYFNAAGCDFDGQIGEFHDPETHLIPLILDAAIGKRECIYIYGDDYDTPDGTCIRDYIHVNDLADAHIKAYEYLCKENKSNVTARDFPFAKSLICARKSQNAILRLRSMNAVKGTLQYWLQIPQKSKMSLDGLRNMILNRL